MILDIDQKVDVFFCVRQEAKQDSKSCKKRYNRPCSQIREFADGKEALPLSEKRGKVIYLLDDYK